MRNNTEFEIIDAMNGHQFEHYCAELLRQVGFTHIQITRGSGDYGVDIIADKDGVSYAIQCKRHNQKIGNKAVQEVLSGKVYYGCQRAVVLTNSYFTNQAVDTAQKTGVMLWDRDTLASMLEALPSSQVSGRKNSHPKKKKGCMGCLMSVMEVLVVLIVLAALFLPKEKPNTESSSSSSAVKPTEESKNTTDSSMLISDTSFPFENAIYTVNGIEVKIESITLKREYKPAGYQVDISYSLSNTNSGSARFSFSSATDNNMIIDGEKVFLAKQASWERGHSGDCTLNAGDTVTLVCDFFATANVKRTIQGESYNPVDISKIYSGQELTIEVTIEGTVGNSSQKVTIPLIIAS
ncbi:MAG: restriction endonuclease [Candidatus Faecousia sp.]|nr:restriction endonuclease [Candidatus Faecousia sp.]